MVKEKQILADPYCGSNSGRKKSSLVRNFIITKYEPAPVKNTVFGVRIHVHEKNCTVCQK